VSYTASVAFNLTSGLGVAHPTPRATGNITRSASHPPALRVPCFMDMTASSQIDHQLPPQKQKRRESFVAGEGPCGGGERGSSWSASPAAEGERRRRLAGCCGRGFEEGEGEAGPGAGAGARLGFVAPADSEAAR
jgi:hypothetical protein